MTQWSVQVLVLTARARVLQPKCKLKLLCDSVVSASVGVDCQGEGFTTQVEVQVEVEGI